MRALYQIVPVLNHHFAPFVQRKQKVFVGKKSIFLIEYEKKVSFGIVTETQASYLQ